MPLQSSSPLIARLLRWFLRGSAVIFVLVTAVTLLVDYNARLRRSQQLVANTVAFTQTAVSRSLWNFDIAQLQAEIDAVVLVDVISRIEVLDERGQLLAHAAKNPELPGAEAKNYPLRDAGSGRVIGSLRLLTSDAPVQAQFRHGALWTVLGEFIEVAVMAALLFYLLHRNVIVHLQALAKAVDELDPKQAAQPLQLPRAAHAPDEIDRVVDAIQCFQREIVAEREARQQIETQSRNLGNELARMGRVAAVQSLTTTIAHELNQPLGAILSNAETLELTALADLPAQDPLREVLTDIVSEARRAGSIVRNMRDLTEKRDVETTPLQLTTLVQQVAALVRLDTRWDDIAVELELTPELPPVLGNAVQLQQVLINLISNARDAMREIDAANGRVTIATQQVDARWLSLTVQDTGPGITPEKFDYILKPFFTTKEGGTGMGLWISQMIVEQHGGKLSCANVAGGGACFTITLPVMMPV